MKIGARHPEEIATIAIVRPGASTTQVATSSDALAVAAKLSAAIVTWSKTGDRNHPVPRFVLNGPPRSPACAGLETIDFEFLQRIAEKRKSFLQKVAKERGTEEIAGGPFIVRA